MKTKILHWLCDEKRIYARSILSVSLLMLLLFIWEPIAHFFDNILIRGQMFMAGIIVIASIVLAIIIVYYLFLAIFSYQLLTTAFPRIPLILRLLCVVLGVVFSPVGILAIWGIWAIRSKKYFPLSLIILAIVLGILDECSFGSINGWIPSFYVLVLTLMIGFISLISPFPCKKRVYALLGICFLLFGSEAAVYYYSQNKALVLQDQFLSSVQPIVAKCDSQRLPNHEEGLSPDLLLMKQLPPVKIISPSKIDELKNEFIVLSKEHEKLILKVSQNIESKEIKWNPLCELSFDKSHSDSMETLLNWARFYYNSALIAGFSDNKKEFRSHINKLAIMRDMAKNSWGIPAGLTAVRIQGMYLICVHYAIRFSLLSPEELLNIRESLISEKKWEHLYIQKSKETLVSSFLYLNAYFKKNIFGKREYSDDREIILNSFGEHSYSDDREIMLSPVEQYNLNSNFWFYGILKNWELFTFYKMYQQYLSILSQPQESFRNKIKKIENLQDAFPHNFFVTMILTRFLEVKSAFYFADADELDLMESQRIQKEISAMRE